MRMGITVAVICGVVAVGCQHGVTPVKATAAPVTVGRVQYRQSEKDLLDFEMSVGAEKSVRLGTVHGTEGVAVIFANCGFSNAVYLHDQKSVAICNEYVRSHRRWNSDLSPGVLRMTILHELGHAAFDLGHIPFTGLEEAAADEFAAYITLTKGDPKDLLAKAKFWGYIAETFQDYIDDGSDPHPTAARRSTEMMCLYLGATGDLEGAGTSTIFDLFWCKSRWKEVQEHWTKILAI